MADFEHIIWAWTGGFNVVLLDGRDVTGAMASTRSSRARVSGLRLMLLLSGTLQPYGSSKLASVRFSGPVRIRSIRIYPKGSHLFSQSPDAIR